MVPRETLVNDIKIMDTLFKQFHQNSSDGLLRTNNVISGLVELFSEKFGHIYDKKLLKKYAMCRTMRCMRWIHQQMTAHQAETIRSKKKKLDYHYNQIESNEISLQNQTIVSPKNQTHSPNIRILNPKIIKKDMVEKQKKPQKKNTKRKKNQK